MGRRRSSKYQVYENGPVRVLEYPSKGGYRILWSEAKKQRERTATRMKDAKEIADTEAARLLGRTIGADGSATSVGALLSAATDPARHTWQAEWAYGVQRSTAKHLIPAIGGLRCDQLTREVTQTLLKKMTAQGYAYSTVAKVRNILSSTVELGIEKGIWTPGNNPMRGVKVPPSQAKADDGRPDRDLIPTVAQVEALRQIAYEKDEQYGVMVTVAAYTGVRWGELLALTADRTDLDRKRMRVELVCVEDQHGRFKFRPPMKGRGRSTRSAALRTIALGPEARRALSRYMGTLRRYPVSNLIETETPDHRLFARDDGAPHRRTFQSKLFGEMTAAVSAGGETWPDGATWHYLRHFCATHWIRDKGIDVATVSRMLGHARVSTTFDWYVDTDQKAIDRANEILDRADEEE